MTENGYRFANWLCDKRDNLLVGLAYLTLAVLILIVAGISLQPTQPKVEKRLHISADHDYDSRR